MDVILTPGEKAEIKAKLWASPHLSRAESTAEVLESHRIYREHQASRPPRSTKRRNRPRRGEGKGLSLGRVVLVCLSGFAICAVIISLGYDEPID